MALFNRRRQSAPKPTAEEYLASMQTDEAPEQTGTPIEMAVEQPIGKEQIEEANQILLKYQQGKKFLDQRIVNNENWYKVRYGASGNGSDVGSKSAWLFNAIANKHAEAMDNYPRPNILPREEGDQQEAKILSSIIPVILDQAEFEQTYSDEQMYKLKSGTGVYGVFWDGSKLNGLGDVAINKIDLLNVYWEPGITDIQRSPHLFYVYKVDNDQLEAQYPQLAGKLSTETITVTDYQHDDSVDNSNKSAVVDWYYKRQYGTRTVLHYCKYVNNVVLYSSENEEATRERGFYDHGKYPFVFDTLYKVEDSPAGFGFIDIGKSPQEDIDLGNQAMMENLLQGCRPRYFERIDGSINEEEFADWRKRIVHVEGNLGEDSVRTVDIFPLSSVYVDVLNGKIDELKETTGNRDINSGGTTGGVTAASGIAAMQEAGAKLTRDNNKASYRAFRQVVLLIIELIRQFYDISRQFRIIGEKGAAEFVDYNNSGIVPQQNEGGIRVPLFDVEVTAEKASPYSRMAQNELMLDFYNRGFFNPQLADQALMCLKAMDFDNKDQLIQEISQNAQMLQQMMMLAQMVDQAHGTTEVTEGIMAQYGMSPPSMSGGEPTAETESPITANARQRVAESTQV